MKKALLYVTIFISAITLAGCSSSSPYSNLDEFAQCLTDKGVILYGTTTCPYCQKQKALFGDSIAKINFVDCKANPMKCNLAGINSIPHRYISESKGLNGLQSLETLSKESGCELINKK